MNGSIIDIRNLHKTYPGATHPSINGLTLRIAEGMFFGLLGPNGAGKTTTLSILCGLRRFDDGEVQVRNLDVRSQMREIKPLIGVVPQDIALYSELTIRENLRFFGGVHQIPSKELNRRIDEYIELFDLKEHTRKRTAYLSGGMKRKVNLIVALLHRPEILFLDEPTTGIDVLSKQEIAASLSSLNRTGMTIVYTSHDMAEAEKLCTYVALMDHGKIVCEGTPSTLLSQTDTVSLEQLFIARTGVDI